MLANMEPPNNELIVPVLINGAIFAAVAVIVPAFLLSRFVRDIAGRAVLVIFLFAAAGAYFAFATLGREVADARPIWTLVELLQVVVFGAVARLARLSLLAGCGMGLASTLGCFAALHRTRTSIYSVDLCDCVYQF